MTRPYDHDTFDHEFDAAVHDMHARMPRGQRPSSRVWQQVQQQAGIPDSSANDRGAAGHATSRQQSRFAEIAHVSQGSRGTFAPKVFQNWTALLTAALVVILIGTSVNFLLPESNNGSDSSEHSIALAPGTPDMSVFTNPGVATPSASPEAIAQTFGPEYACHAEPLTADQVFDIVMNPARERARRGSESQGAVTGLREDYWWLTNQVHAQYNQEPFEPVDDPEQAQTLIDTSNQFWNCLMTGTAFQVWALTDPAAVQHEILAHYPVVRDEDILRQHIGLWGDLPYRSGLHTTFSVFPTYQDQEHLDAVEVSMTADRSYGSVRILPVPYEGGEHSRARVLMTPHPEATRWANLRVQVEFTLAADGTWWARNIIVDTQ